MKDNISSETGLYFPTNDADDAFCRLYGQVRQLYYLDLDCENGAPVDREQLERTVNSILYIAIDTENKIRRDSIPGHIDSMKMETRGGTMPVYKEMVKNLRESYNALRRYAKNRISAV